MLNTLYSKLAAALFGLVCLIGLLFFLLVRYSTEMYQQEVSQKLNTALAQNIVHHEPLLKDKHINEAAVKDIFHMLMVVNPRIEVYLLDQDGRILDYDAPVEKIQRQRVDTKAIKQFVSGDIRYPVLGDDPRDTNKQKIFSAAPVMYNNSLQGYLYIILSGEEVDSITQMLHGSYIARFTLLGVIASLLVALAAGLLIFFLLTGRLRYLSDVIASYTKDSGMAGNKRFTLKNKKKDEIDKLGEQFNIMADRIDEQLQALQRNDSQRRELVANVSHDLRTPLATLHGYLETLLLKDTELSEEERQRYLEIAVSHSHRLNQLVSELFELSKLDSCETLLNVEPFSLGELIQDVIQKFVLMAKEKQISLTTDYGQGLPFAYGDIAMMQRVLENLLENAIRHTPTGGHISVSLAKTSDKILVKVADTGCGIPEDEIPFIFERFYRLEKSRQGGQKNAGLGLAIVKKILELHGSRIRAESKQRKGTIFSFEMATR